MKGCIADFKREPKWVKIREIFFIVLFIITVIGLGIVIASNETRSPKVEETDQACCINLLIKGMVGGNEAVARGPRYTLYPTATGVYATQNANKSIDMVFTQNFGELLINVYDMSDKVVLEMFAHTSFQSSFKFNLLLVPPGTYWLELKNSKGGTGLTMFTKS